MTIDELERDLRTLAEPQVADERLRRELRERLPVRSRPRRTRMAFGSAALAAAAAAAAVFALVGSDGPSSANAAILRHANRVMNPPADKLVHVREVGTQPDGTPVSVEWWQETNPPYTVRLIKTAGATRGEGTRSGPLVDPIESARRELADGNAEVAGTATIDGRSLYKIELPDGSFVYFDKADYQPLYVDNRQRDDGSMVRTRVVAYEELPLTAENRQLLHSAQRSKQR